MSGCDTRGVVSLLFTAAEPPKSIIDRAGRHLADRLDGFVWATSTQRLSGPTGDGQRLSLGLNGSTRSRAGIGTWVRVQVTVHDVGLRRWRRTHPESALRSDDWLFFDNLGNLLGGHGTVELFGPLRQEGHGHLTLPDLERIVDEQILPTCGFFRTPAEAAARLPDRWLNRPEYLAEWAVAQQDFKAARGFIARALEANPGWVPAFERGIADASRGESSPPHHNAAEALGATTYALSQISGEVLAP